MEDPDADEWASPETEISIGARGADPTHHVKLVDSEMQSVGFVVTDQVGDLDERTFRRFPMSDPQNPYVTEKQGSFGAGFGQSTFEENRAKYWRSKGVDTTKDALVLAPMFHYGKGNFAKAQEHMPVAADEMDWEKIRGAFAYMAMPFTPLLQWTSSEYVKLWIQKVGNAPSLRIRFYTNSGGEPDTLIHTEDIAASTFTEPDGQWMRFAVEDTYTYAAVTQYWIVLTTTGDGDGYYQVLHQKSGTAGKRSTDGITWAGTSPDFYFRVEGGPRLSARHTFFTYKRQMYVMAAYDEWNASTLFMNGWRGAADDNTGALNKLKDSSKNWTGYITGQEVVEMVAGPASAEVEDRRYVASGGNGELTLDSDGLNWQITHTIRDDYIVTNTDWFTQVAVIGNVMNGRVTDVTVANGVMYICRGNNRTVSMFREYNRAGTWTTNWTSSGVSAQFARVVNDPISGDILWFGHNRLEDGEYKPWVWQSGTFFWGESGTWGMALVRHQANGVGEFWQNSDPAVAVTEIKLKEVQIRVTLGEVTGASVNAQGSGYAQNEKLYFNEGAANQVTFNIDSVGGSGEVLSISIDDGGYDYDQATGQATTTNGGGNGATVDIDTVSTLTGQIAYTDLYEMDDVTARTLDIRNNTYATLDVKFSHVNGEPNEIAEGDLQLELDNNQGCGSPFATVNIPNLISDFAWQTRKNIALDLTTTAGAEACTSIGLKLHANHSITRSFDLLLIKEMLTGRQILPVTVGQEDGDNITGLESYGDPETLWVMTEAGFGQIKNNRFLPVPMREIKTARHANNGRGHVVSDVYLMFTWKGRLQRYYRQNMEDLGPDFPRGMGDIAGEVVDVISYPGRMYAAVDAGDTGRSSILCHKGGAWHEVYTAFPGERIRKLFIQPIEGRSDKLWASVGADIMWFPITLDAAELPANSDYTYAPTGYLDTSWIYTEDKDLEKIFRSLVVTMDKAKDINQRVMLYWKTDNEDADWEKVTNFETLSYSTIKFDTVHGNNRAVRGNRIKFRLHLWTHEPDESPVVRAIQSRIYRVPEVKYAYTWLSKVSSISINLRGDEEKVVGTKANPEVAFGTLDYWAEHLVPLLVESDIASLNGKTVVIEPIPFQLLLMVHDEKIQEESIQITANEI
jgi:hypothetical protein